MNFDKFINNLKTKLIEANKETGEELLKDAKDRIEIPDEARNKSQFVQYRGSLKTKTELEDGKIITHVYSDLVVNDGSKWDGVPIGAFLEWGTGPMGDRSNNYPHGYPYTLDKPWDEHTTAQWFQTGTWGISARPHLYPALQAIKPIYKENIERKVKEAWKMSEK